MEPGNAPHAISFLVHCIQNDHKTGWKLRITAKIPRPSGRRAVALFVFVFKRGKQMKAAIALVAGAFAFAGAQVGDGGWAQYHPAKTIQLRGGGTHYQDSAGIESFIMSKGDERCEARIANDYKTGTNQFEGYVRVTSGQGTSVHQVFKFLMIVAYPQNGGELHQHSQTFLTDNAFGNWVRVNTIHNTAQRKAYVYINGELKYAMGDANPSSPEGWYNKYGVYNTNTGSKSEWRDIKYWKQTDNSNGIVPLRPGRPWKKSPQIYDLKGDRIPSRLESPAAGAYFPWGLPNREAGR
jgi:hypothetical protein